MKKEFLNYETSIPCFYCFLSSFLTHLDIVDTHLFSCFYQIQMTDCSEIIAYTFRCFFLSHLQTGVSPAVRASEGRGFESCIDSRSCFTLDRPMVCYIHFVKLRAFISNHCTHFIRNQTIPLGQRFSRIFF